MDPAPGRPVWHGATFAVALFALVAQTVLAIRGAVLVDVDPPTLTERMVRLVGYFTIQANMLVAVTRFTLLRDRTGTAGSGGWSGSPPWSASP